MGGSNVCHGAASSKPGRLAETPLPPTPEEGIWGSSGTGEPPLGETRAEMVLLYNQLITGGERCRGRRLTAASAAGPPLLIPPKISSKHFGHLWPGGPWEPGADDDPNQPHLDPPTHNPGAVFRLRPHWVSALWCPRGWVRPWLPSPTSSALAGAPGDGAHLGGVHVLPSPFGSGLACEPAPLLLLP